MSRTAKGIREARSLRARLAVEVQQGQHGGTKATVAHLLDAWNAQREQEGASPTTLHEDRRKIATVVVPALGDKALVNLTTRDLDRFYGSQMAAGVSLATVKHLHAILRSALNQAVTWGWLGANPALRARVGRQKGPRPVLHVPSVEEVRRLIEEAAASYNPELAGAFLVSALTGVRAGELCALRFSDVAEGLTVRASVWERGGKWGVKDTKSHQVRTIPVHPLVRKVVEDRRLLLRSLDGPEDGYVWSRDGFATTPWFPRAVSQAFGRIAKRAGVSCRLHDLRHFMATQALAAGFDVVTVSQWLGHARPSTTSDIYGHSLDTRTAELADHLGGLLALTRENPTGLLLSPANRPSGIWVPGKRHS